MVGLERTVVPLVVSKEFGLVLRTATVSRRLLLVASAEQPEAVKGDGDGGAHVGEHGEPQRHQPEGSQQDEQAFDEYRDRHVLLLFDPLSMWV
jgi:hypothetical protein